MARVLLLSRDLHCVSVSSLLLSPSLTQSLDFATGVRLACYLQALTAGMIAAAAAVHFDGDNKDADEGPAHAAYLVAPAVAAIIICGLLLLCVFRRSNRATTTAVTSDVPRTEPLSTPFRYDPRPEPVSEIFDHQQVVRTPPFKPSSSVIAE